MSPIEQINQGTAEEKPEQEPDLTPEDRERISALLRSTGNENLIYWFPENQESVSEHVRKLQNENGKAARLILERIADKNADELRGKIPDMLHYIEALSFCASPKEAGKIGEILIGENIALYSDRSYKARILEIIQRVGTAENINQLLAFARMASRSDYPYDKAHLIQSDICGAISALEHITNRLISEDDKQKAREARQRLQEILLAAAPEEPGLPAEERDWEGEYSNETEPDWEDLQDSGIVNDYETARLETLKSRLDIVNRLRHEVKKERGTKEEPEEDDTKFLRRHWLEYRENNPPPLAPTLGIEIEIREHSAFPKNLEESEYKWFKSREEKMDKYRLTEKLGVPKGADQLWEFAHHPARYYHTLSREVQALIEMGLINKEYRKHSLHLTIGGVTSYGRARGAFVLARALEATGWSTTGGRLLRPFLTNQFSWAVKGNAGVSERHKDRLELGEKSAVEIRTFQLQSIAGLDRLLRSAYLLGAALKASRKRFEPDSPQAPARLEDIWYEFVDRCKSIFERYQLPDPEKFSDWDIAWGEEGRVKENNSFRQLAGLLDEGRTDKNSRGAKFMREMRKLVIETRAQIKPLLGLAEPPEKETS